MPSGTVKFFNPAKGFGFIAPQYGGPDIFVHVSAVEQSGLSDLNEGDEIHFDIQPADDGGDVFVHISAVERAGLRGLNEGLTVA